MGLLPGWRWCAGATVLPHPQTGPPPPATERSPRGPPGKDRQTLNSGLLSRHPGGKLTNRCVGQQPACGHLSRTTQCEQQLVSRRRVVGMLGQEQAVQPLHEVMCKLKMSVIAAGAKQRRQCGICFRQHKRSIQPLEAFVWHGISQLAHDKPGLSPVWFLIDGHGFKNLLHGAYGRAIGGEPWVVCVTQMAQGFCLGKEAAAAMPRRNDRCRPVLHQEKIRQLFHVESGHQNKFIVSPERTETRLLLLGHQPDDAESFEVRGKGLRPDAVQHQFVQCVTHHGHLSVAMPPVRLHWPVHPPLSSAPPSRPGGTAPWRGRHAAYTTGRSSCAYHLLPAPTLLVRAKVTVGTAFRHPG